MNDTHQELRDLITRVVTGDGAQLENLDMEDEELTETAEDGELTVTITVENWLALVEIARNNR